MVLSAKSCKEANAVFRVSIRQSLDSPAKIPCPVVTASVDLAADADDCAPRPESPDGIAAAALQAIG
jgi:hypothetical protein